MKYARHGLLDEEFRGFLYVICCALRSIETSTGAVVFGLAGWWWRRGKMRSYSLPLVYRSVDVAMLSGVAGTIHGDS